MSILKNYNLTVIAGLILLSMNYLSAKDITTYHKNTFGEVSYNKFGLASIVTEDGWVVIDKKKKVLHKVFMFDKEIASVCSL